MPKRMRAEWQAYRDQVLPANASAIQIREAELAFFSGARSLFSLLSGALDGGRSCSTADLLIMYEVQEELEVFCREVLR